MKPDYLPNSASRNGGHLIFGFLRISMTELIDYADAFIDNSNDICENI